MNKHPSAENLRDAALVSAAVRSRPAKGRAKEKPATITDSVAKRTCIMVLGMHRSGTSALTRAINLLGAELPKNLLGALPSNPTGHWEPARLIGLHDQMLTEVGSSWDDWRPFDQRSLGAGRLQFYKAEITRLIEEEYGSKALFVLKEPRISRFVPLYAGVLKRMRIDVRYVLINRNPLSVSNSLLTRNGLTLTFSSLLWLRHELDAEKSTRNSPRTVVSYEDLVRNGRLTLSRVGDELGLVWPRSVNDASDDIDKHLSAEHEHHLANYDQLESARSFPKWLSQSYAAILALTSNSADVEAFATLDRVASEFDEMSANFGNAFYPELKARLQNLDEQYSAQMLAVDERRSELEQLAAAREQAANAYLVEIKSLRSRLAGAEKEIDSIRISRLVRLALFCQRLKNRTGKVVPRLLKRPLS